MPVKIIDVQDLAIPEVKVIRFARFRDHRGYFTEPYRFSDFETGDATPFFRGVRFPQANESYSRAGTVRGLHFQWNPYMGKLSTLLAWHAQDPPNAAEKNRNQIIYSSYQRNRNPFIDHPEWATAIWN